MTKGRSLSNASKAEIEAVKDTGAATLAEDHATTKWQAVKANPRCCLWVLYMVFVLCLQGFDNQAGGIVLGIEQFRKDFGYAYKGNYVLPATWQAAYSGGPVATTVFGALIAGMLGDWLGRRWTIFLAICNTFVAVGIEFSSTTNSVFFAGKMLCGVSIGIFNTMCVSYISEISPLALRGITTALSNLSLCIGPLICVGIGAGYGDLPNRWAYRGIFVAQWGFGVIAIAFAPFLPESPWWLVAQGKDEAAKRSLKRLGMNEADAAKHLAFIQLTQLKAAEENSGSASYLECFRGSNLRRTIVTIMPLTIQALSGVAFVSGYSTYYFQLAGYDVPTSFKLQIGCQILSLSGNVTSWFIIDRFGRRPLILWGTTSLTALLLVTGGLASSTSPGPLTGTVALIMLYCFWYNLVIGAVAYTIIAEIPTQRLRAKTIGLSLICQQTLFMAQYFILPYLFNPDKANLGAKVAFIYGAMSVCCCIYLYFFHPESAGRSFRELDELFFKKVPSREFKGYVTEAEAQGEQALADKKVTEPEEFRS